MKKLSWLLLVGFVAYACQTDEVTPDQVIQSKSFKVTSGNFANARLAEDACGESHSVTLWAGQHIDAGSVEVYNNEESLFVVYTATGGWGITETHLYVGSNPPKNKQGIPVPGHFPYSATHDLVTNVIYEIPLADLDDCFEVYAHCVVKKQGGTQTESQTAWGGDTAGTAPRWYFYTDYCVQDCEDECVPSQDVAWSDGSLYDAEGGFATYTEYANEEKTVTLFNSQGAPVGTVTFSAPWFDPQTSKARLFITVEVTDCWDFAVVPNNVKIQGYNGAPSGTPSPELFTILGDGENHYFSVEVQGYPYYGVHVDVIGGCCE